MSPRVIVVVALADSIGVARFAARGTRSFSQISFLMTTTCAPPSKMHSGWTPGAKVGKMTRRGSDEAADEEVSYLTRSMRTEEGVSGSEEEVR